VTRAASDGRRGGGGGIASAARRGGGRDDHSDPVPGVIAREEEGYFVKHPSSIWAGLGRITVLAIFIVARPDRTQFRACCRAPPNRTVFFF